MAAILEREKRKPDGLNRYERIWFVIQDYAIWTGDDDLLEAYQRTLRNKPWEQCDCPICQELGIEVCIFRGNDRNRRRGFHNTDRFYDEFSEALPKTFVATKGSASLGNYDTVESYLKREEPAFWDAVHDLPVAEIGVIDANGIHEWWETPPDTISFAPGKMTENLQEALVRYDQLFLYDGEEFRDQLTQTLRESVDQIETIDEGSELRQRVLASLGDNYVIGQDFIPHAPVFQTSDGLDILIIDQCSGSKYIPEGMREFDINEVDSHSKEELLRQENVRGVAASDLYTGRQQKYVTSAVRQLRRAGHEVQRYFISAGFGLVGEDERLPPYEVTFSGMKVNEIRNRSAMLHIQEDVTKVLTQSDYDIVFFALGDDYYTSIDIDQVVQHVRPDQIGVVFNRDLVDDQYDNIVSVPARTEDAERHGTIVIGLKGLYLENFAKNLSDAAKIDPETIRTLCRYVDDEPIQAAIEKF